MQSSRDLGGGRSSATEPGCQSAEELLGGNRGVGETRPPALSGRTGGHSVSRLTNLQSGRVGRTLCQLFLPGMVKYSAKHVLQNSEPNEMTQEFQRVVGSDGKHVVYSVQRGWESKELMGARLCAQLSYSSFCLQGRVRTGAWRHCGVLQLPGAALSTSSDGQR